MGKLILLDNIFSGHPTPCAPGCFATPRSTVAINSPFLERHSPCWRQQDMPCPCRLLRELSPGRPAKFWNEWGNEWKSDTCIKLTWPLLFPEIDRTLRLTPARYNAEPCPTVKRFRTLVLQFVCELDRRCSVLYSGISSLCTFFVIRAENKSDLMWHGAVVGGRRHCSPEDYGHGRMSPKGWFPGIFRSSANGE